MGANGRLAALEVLKRARPVGGLTWPRGTRYDAIVVGAGHNGLVAAAYLARAGRGCSSSSGASRVGGAVDTASSAPGVRVPAVAHTIGRLRPSVVARARAQAPRPALVAPDVRVFAPQPDGRRVTLWADAGATVDGLAATGRGRRRRRATPPSTGGSGRSAASWPTSATRPRPTSTRPGLGDALAGPPPGSRVPRPRQGRRPDDPARARRWPSPTSWPSRSRPTPIRARHRLARRPLHARWARGRRARRRSCSTMPPATTAARPARRSSRAAARARWRDALAAAARAAGGEIRTDAEVVAITRRDGRATGVALASGEEIGAHGRRRRASTRSGLLTTLVDPVALGPSMRWRAGNIRTPGSVAKVNLVLPACPRSRPRRRRPRLLRGRILVGDDRRSTTMERAFDAAKYGRLLGRARARGDDPLARRSVARRGRCRGHARDERRRPVGAVRAPRRRPGTTGRDALGDAVMRQLETVAPGLGARVAPAQVLTPLDLERDYGLTGGHPLHARAGARPVLPLAAAARPRALPDAARRALPRGLRCAPRWRRDGRARPERRARGPRRPETSALTERRQAVASWGFSNIVVRRLSACRNVGRVWWSVAMAAATGIADGAGSTGRGERPCHASQRVGVNRIACV